MEKCCKNPKIVSRGQSDCCKNCGKCFDHEEGVEYQDDRVIPFKEDREDEQ